MNYSKTLLSDASNLIADHLGKDLYDKDFLPI